jgi:molybdate transport system substrate-binding protein
LAGIVHRPDKAEVDVSHARELKVMAAGAVKEAYRELVAAFETASGYRVVTIWGGTDGLAARIGDGEVVDVVIVAAPSIDRLIGEGKLAAGSRADIATSGVGIALRAGLPRPDISSTEAVKRAVLAARSVAYSTGPSGSHVAELFERMGIADLIRNKVMQPVSGELVAHGEADLGFEQISNLLAVKGIDYLGPLPPEIQNITVYSGAVHARAPAPDAARAMVKFLTAPQAGPIFRKIGMNPS